MNRQDTFEVHDGDRCLGMVWRAGERWQAGIYSMTACGISGGDRSAAAAALRAAVDRQAH